MSIALLALATLAPSFQDPAARLAASPRHHEWIEAKHGTRTVRCFVVYPEVKAKVPAVVLIHENKGLTDWVRSVADELAAAGYVALAPDLLSGAGPEGGHTESFASADAATKAIYALDPKQVLADLDAVLAFAQIVPASNGKVSVAGFCWGGSKAFEYAAHQETLTAAYVFYGSAPKEESAFAAMKCPVHGFYGESDARITAGVEAAAAAMKAASKTYEPTIYPGAGHGFLRAGEAPDASPENKAAREAAWKRWKELLAR
jgi:carboxymethylenebutenolidase